MSKHTLQVAPRGEREVVMSRRFDAPRPLVFDAHTKPELLKRWFHGPDGWRLEVCEVDLRVGGKVRFVWAGPDGPAMGLSGVHKEIEIPSRIVRTEKFDQDWTGGETLGTTVFDERDGGTEVTVTVEYASKEGRDGALASNMAEGVSAAFDRLERQIAAGEIA